MSLDFTSGGGGPVPVDIAVQGGRFVFVLSDGTTKESGVFPAFDSSTLDALILANRDAITAILGAVHSDKWFIQNTGPPAQDPQLASAAA